MIIEKPKLGLILSPTHPFTNGLMGAWTMSEGSGAATYDRTNNSNDGALISAPAFAAGKYGPSVSLNGSTQYVNCGASTTLKFTSAFTLSAWVKLKSIGGVDTIVSMWDTGTPFAYRFIIIGGQVYLPVFDDSVVDAQIGRTSVGSTLSTDIWYHLAGTYDGGTTAASLRIYLNGIRIDDTDNNGAGAASFVAVEQIAANFVIGATNDATDFLDADVDNVMVWNRHFTDDEVLQLYGEPFGMWENTVPGWLLDAMSTPSADVPSKTAAPTASQMLSGGMVGGQYI